MTVEVTRHPKLPVVYLKIVQPVQVPGDIETNMKEGLKLKSELGGHVYRIIDVREMNLSFSDMMVAMATDRKGEGTLDDSDVTTLYVGGGDLVAFGVKALAEQDQYGQLGVKLFASDEEAYAYVVEDMKNR